VRQRSEDEAAVAACRRRTGDAAIVVADDHQGVREHPRLLVAERIVPDPSFACVLLDEAASLFLNGEPETARVTLRDLVNATVGFERLAAPTGKPAKSLLGCYSLRSAISGSTRAARRAGT
jgi:hypothetical protein